jgi:hypothetical protein
VLYAFTIIFTFFVRSFLINCVLINECVLCLRVAWKLYTPDRVPGVFGVIIIIILVLSRTSLKSMKTNDVLFHDSRHGEAGGEIYGHFLYVSAPSICQI